MHPFTDLITLAFHLANRAVVEDIESEGTQTVLAGTLWWDTAAMVDPREHSSEVVAMAQQAIDYALGRGLVVQHPQRPHLLHILVQPTLEHP